MGLFLAQARIPPRFTEEGLVTIKRVMDPNDPLGKGDDMDYRQRTIDYLNDNGFVTASCVEQEEAIKSLVAEGVIHQVKPEWFNQEFRSVTSYYVSTSVDRKHKMPISMWKMVVERPPFFKGEFVLVSLKNQHGMSSDVLGRVLGPPHHKSGIYEVSLMGGSIAYVTEKEMMRTFNPQESV